METMETMETMVSGLGGSLEGSVIGFLLPSSFSFASNEAEAEAGVDDVVFCVTGTEAGAFTDNGMEVGAVALVLAGAGAGTEMGATPGSGIGMPADPATEFGSNLVFMCAVLLVIHKTL